MKTALRLLSALLCLLALSLAVTSCDLFGVKTTEATEAPKATESPAPSSNSTDGTSEEAPTEAVSGIWLDALYISDQEFGSGARTVTVQVAAEGKTVVFTIHTDKRTVGEALLEHGLLAGEEGPYGLYVKHVNGMEADYDKDQTYWAFYVNGGYAMSGVELTDIEEGTVYRLEKQK